MESSGPFGWLLDSLPPFIRDLLPFGPPLDAPKEDSAATKLERERITPEDLCFIHSIPGDDEDEALIVLADGSLRKFIHCGGINALLYDDAEKEQLGRHLCQLVDSVESDIQFISTLSHENVEEYLKTHQASARSDNEYLRWYGGETEKWFAKVQQTEMISRRMFYVVVGFQPPDIKGLKKVWNGRRSIQRHEEYVEIISRQTKSIGEQLRNFNLRPSIMTKRQARNLIYRHLNPALAASNAKAPSAKPGQSESSALACSPLKRYDTHIELDGCFIGTQYMAEMPLEPKTGWLLDLMTLSIEHTLSLFIHSCEEQAGSGADRVFDVSCYVMTQADSAEKMKQGMDEARRALKGAGAVLDRAQMLQTEAWQSTLPVGVDRLAMTQNLPLPVVGTLFPFFTAHCGSSDGVPLGLTVPLAEPVLFNPFAAAPGKISNNMLIVGSPYANKSLVASLLVLRLLPMAVRFIISSRSTEKIGEPFRFATELLGPEFCSYIELGSAAGQMLNPFDLGLEDKAGEPSVDKINMLLALFDIMLAPEGRQEINPEEQALLEGLLRVVYMDAGLRGAVPVMSDLARITAQAITTENDILQRERLQQLLRGLTLFSRGGPFGALIDGYTNVDTEKLLIVFDNQHITDSRLERMIAFIQADFMQRKAAESKQRGLKLSVILDEAAVLMRFRTGAKMLDDLSRRCQQYGVMLVSMTERLSEFYSHSELADSLVKSAQMKLLLRQESQEIELLKDVLRLKESEAKAVEGFTRGEESALDSLGLLMIGDVRGSMRLVVSQMDYWICTTEPTNDVPSRREMIQEVKSRTPNLNHTDACRQAVYYLGLQ